MQTKALSINETHVANYPVTYVCHGLGSCIGLFVADRQKRISGGAHIPLPDSSATGHFKGTDSLIACLLNSLKELGSDGNALRAKITGGANLFDSTLNIGEKNIKAIVRRLVEKNIFIASMDVGGCVSRTARFNSITHDLLIVTSEPRSYCI